MLKRDSLWSKSKNLMSKNQSKQADHPDRLSHSQFDLTNFDQPIHQNHAVATLFLNKRNQKLMEKRQARQELLVSKRLPMNRYGNAKKLFGAISMENEKYSKATEETAAKSNLKRGPLKRLNDYVNPILQDQDPDNGIEEEYKSKHKQVFCWRFLRTLSYIDQSTFFQRKESGGENKGVKTFNGDVEQLAGLIHEQAKKREIIEARAEEENEQEQEDHPMELDIKQEPEGDPEAAMGLHAASVPVGEEDAGQHGMAGLLNQADAIQASEGQQPQLNTSTGPVTADQAASGVSKIEEIQKHVKLQVERRSHTKN